MQAIQAIHQFHFSCSVGDSITNGLFFMRRLLRELGFASEIYCEEIPVELETEVRPLSTLPQGDDFLLIQHHSLGVRNVAWRDTLRAPCVLFYHNITPANLLPSGDLQERCSLGREQLKQWASGCVGAIGASEYSSNELRAAGFRHIATLPLLVDLDKVRQQPWDTAMAERFRNQLNVLFVGRICEHKRQHEIIDVFEEFLHFTDQPARLILAGGVTSNAYLEGLRALIAERGATERIIITDKVSDPQLQSLYRVADLFVCLSGHEGFCMPILEAMAHDVPVVARDAGALAATLGPGGLLLAADETDPRKMAALWQTLLVEPGLRRRVIAGQRRNLARYESRRLLHELGRYLVELGCTLPVTPAMPVALPATSPPPYWRVEGPIDSTYSLAIVNRELALALAARGQDVSLYCPIGTQGGSQDPRWLEKHAPAALPLARRALQQQEQGAQPAITLRFNYPPWVDGMAGEIRAVHCYGWEESAFPQHFVDAFNRGLDGITTLSTQVSKILRDSGVRVPMAAVGTGVDHVLRDTPRAMALPQAANAAFRFLHVSSCFPRKGVDILLAAYGKAFNADDDVVLIIKTFPNPHNDVALQLDRLRREYPQYPRVVLIEDDLPQDQLLWLYGHCHAFVAPSRGEGFGMPMAEAMLFDLPVIVTGWGGQTDFCTDNTAWLCDYDLVYAQSHLDVPHSLWAEPRADHLTQLMREVLSADESTLRIRTHAARERILRDFTWDRVAERTQAAMAGIAAQPAWRKQPHVGWITTWNTRCGIANYSRFLANAFPADRLAVFAAEGREYVSEDEGYVQRCWREDVNLVDPGQILEALKACGIGALVIQYNFGFFSLKALGRIVRELREQGIPSYVFLHSTADVDRDGLHISLRQITDDLRLAARLVVHSPPDVNRLKSYGLVDNVLMFPHGVLATPVPPSEQFRLQHGLLGKRVVATYGFMLPHKGTRELIGAFARLAGLDTSLHLLLVCALYPADVSVQERDECQALVAQLGLTGRVTMINDFLPDAQSLAWLQMADLIVYPYQFTQESSSAAVRGGLAAGRAVAVTPLSIFDDVSQAVHKLPGTSEADLAAGIWLLLTDPKALESLRERGRQWSEPRQWPKVSRRLLNLIDGVANDLPPAI